MQHDCTSLAVGNHVLVNGIATAKPPAQPEARGVLGHVAGVPDQVLDAIAKVGKLGVVVHIEDVAENGVAPEL